MRKFYIDNVRILCILLLFPYHTSMVFNAFGEPFYVHSKSVGLLTYLMTAIYPWWMNLLFALAGISSAYALKKRSTKEYATERVSKLLIPFLFGLILIIPVQSYIADVFHNGYSEGYLKHYVVFFTKFTDLSGYDGGFTPAHTWFMLYLFIISMISLPLMKWYKNREKKLTGSKITIPILIPMFLIILLMTPILEIGGKSIGESLACFLLGFFLLSLEEVQNKLLKYRLPLTAVWLIAVLLRLIMYRYDMGSGILWDIEQRVITWFGILAILGLGQRYLNLHNRFTRYFSPASFPLYFLHQSALIIVAFLIVRGTDIIWLQFLSILILSFALTILGYEIFRRISVTRFMFGIKR